MKKIIFLLIITSFFGCSNLFSKKRTFPIDNTSFVAKSYDYRIKSIIVHYTAINDEKSLKVLSEKNVSVHYVVTTKDYDPIYSLVPDDLRAWHAGVSSFDGRTGMNDTAIGIEIVNLGYNTKQKFNPKKNGRMAFRDKSYYYPFTDVQIEKVAYLIMQLKEKYKIDDKYILAHSDIAPQRKQDPGPYFPWKLLFTQYNIGHWYDEDDLNFFYNKELYYAETPKDIKGYFKKYGYEINDTDEWDDTSRKVIYAFQMRFRPEKSDGNMDLETYAIIRALNKKYSK